MNTTKHFPEHLLACPECDLLQTRVPLAPGQKMTCPRCGAVLDRKSTTDIDHLLAYTVAAIICLCIANAFPIMTLETMGQQSNATLIETAMAMYRQDMLVVSMLVLGTALVAPALMLLAMLYLLVLLRLGQVSPGFAVLFRVFQHAAPWTMIEVLMLGIVVAFVKLSGLATAGVGVGLWAFAAVMILFTLLANGLSEHDLWLQYETAQKNNETTCTDEAANITTTQAGI